MSLNNDNDNHTRLLPENIIVLAHGNNGSPSDFDLMEKILMQKYADDDVLVIKSAANCKSTRKGIEIGGQALAQEIIDILASHKINPHVTRYKFSMVGHSLGGLYGRYSLVYIMDGLNHLNIEYVDFVTICTPHLGSRRPSAKSTWKVNNCSYNIHIRI
jgi:triacylglycerol esterase/lipase EstA (alpha/beta hydrolase family)